VTNCSECRALLVEYERGELDAARDAAIYSHLQACDACRAEWRSDLDLIESLRESLRSEREFPTAILAGVRQAMYAERPPSLAERLRAALRPAVAAPVAAAILVVGSILGYQRAHQPQPTLTGMDYVREHVAQTAGLASSDREWATYVLTSENAGTAPNAGSPPNE